MPTGWREDDADALVTGAAAGNVRRLPPIAQPRDLQAALAPLDDDQYGPKIFENLGLQDFTPDKVTRVSDLLKLRSYVLTQLGLRYVWLIKLPMSSDGHILSVPGLLATFFQGLLILRALPLSASSGVFSFILSILW
jgi:hypothetical protein